MNKKRIVLIAMVIICAALLAGVTLAYFTVEETAYNVITTGTLDMILHEETTDGEPWPEEGIEGVLPGMVVDKVVYLENTGSVDFYARIALEKIITAAEGVDEELNFEHITLDIDGEHWIEQDGYYYYHRALLPGEKTEPLFNTVDFGMELGNEYMDARVEIEVSAEAVQSRNNGDDPLTASGWPTEEETDAE